MPDRSHEEEVTTLLRNNPGMVRDAWFSGDGYLVIRQTKYGNDGTEPVTKQIRLSPEEQHIVLDLLNGVKTNARPLA